MPQIVLSDASPVRALDYLGLLRLFPALYGTLILPTAVHRELLRATSTCRAIDASLLPYFHLQSASVPSTQLGVPSDLDPGETEAITLALELRADLLIIDERRATTEARKLGIKTIGVIGLLLEAKRAGHIPAIMPLLTQLETGIHFFLSPQLKITVRQLARE